MGPGPRLLIGVLTALALLVLGIQRPWAQALVADLSNHVVAINTGFTGQDVVLFGTVDGTGEVAVVIQGPEGEVTVRRKERRALIWMNTTEMAFDRVPAFYLVATSAPLPKLAEPAVLKRHEIGFDNVQLVALGQASAKTIVDYRAALIRNKQRAGLYSTGEGTITFIGQRLFRTTLHFPATVPTGRYTVNTYLIREGEVVKAQASSLVVSKVGFSAALFDFARDQAVFYALAGLALAVGSGWAAGALFRRS